jgi:predicted phosphoribosyltransferase
MWKNRAQVDQEIRQLLQYRVQENDPKTALIVFDGLAELEPLKKAAGEWRAKGAARIIVGVGVMPAHLVEPAKALVDELVILKIPIYFKTVAQFFETNE